MHIKHLPSYIGLLSQPMAPFTCNFSVDLFHFGLFLSCWLLHMFVSPSQPTPSWICHYMTAKSRPHDPRLLFSPSGVGWPGWLQGLIFLKKKILRMILISLNYYYYSLCLAFLSNFFFFSFFFCLCFLHGYVLLFKYPASPLWLSTFYFYSARFFNLRYI